MCDKEKTIREFDDVKRRCRTLYEAKFDDYGTSWRIMRPSSLTDQIMIKARRIRSLELKGGIGRVDEGIEGEFVGIINYSVMALIQLATPGSGPLGKQQAMELYDRWFDAAVALMTDKNHDYDEAWREMLVSSFTDIILQKLLRIRQIELHDGAVKVSEGVSAGYMDIINYAVFALIKLNETED